MFCIIVRGKFRFYVLRIYLSCSIGYLIYNVLVYCNMKNTNIKVVKDIAIQLIYTKPEPIEDFGFYKHPYIGHPVIMLPDTNESFNIFQDIEKYHLWQEELAENIRHMRNAYSIACLIKTYYKSVFFESIKEYLSEKDFAEILSNYWAAVGITDVPKTKFLLWFQEANKSYLMDKGERKVFDALPEKVTIYRGVDDPEYKYGFSWTLDKKVARWFANRNQGNGTYVYECTVDKKDLICYFQIRNEKEVIINPETLKEYEIRTTY